MKNVPASSASGINEAAAMTRRYTREELARWVTVTTDRAEYNAAVLASAEREAE